jgi:thioredoxin reductase (NADPH)
VSDRDRVFTVVGRRWCHLCDDMVERLQPIADEFGCEIEVLDVDEDEALEERWGLLVPVLLAGEDELCHYRLDVAAVRAYCRGFPLKSVP